MTNHTELILGGIIAEILSNLYERWKVLHLKVLFASQTGFQAVTDINSSVFVKLRVHCAEALGTPIVGDYKYGGFVHRRWKQMPQVDIELTTGKPYKLRRPEGLDVQKGSVLSKVPFLHLHCRELVLPNIAKFLQTFDSKSENQDPALSSKPDLLRFVASMPSHMRISWNLMSSYLV